MKGKCGCGHEDEKRGSEEKERSEPFDGAAAPEGLGAEPARLAIPLTFPFALGVSCVVFCGDAKNNLRLRVQVFMNDYGYQRLDDGGGAAGPAPRVQPGGGAATTQPEIKCTVCTLLNSALAPVCAACGARLPTVYVFHSLWCTSPSVPPVLHSCFVTSYPLLPAELMMWVCIPTRREITHSPTLLAL